MKRRTALVLGAGAVGVGAVATSRLLLDQGILNPCRGSGLPPELAENPVVAHAWDGIDPASVWDCHVHLVGVGHSQSGAWTDPRMASWRHPWKRLQRFFYFNASCVDTDNEDVDNAYVARLIAQATGMMPPGSRYPKLMLMAFDWHRDEHGEPVPERSTFYMPHKWVRDVVARHPDVFEWIGSVHPYRKDALDALRTARANGARAIKWLPAAQGMDPADARCDDFYDVLAELGMPLIVHGGEEQAVDGAAYQELCNPLRLRRPLERGVTVIVAHVASLGDSVDLDRGPTGPMTPAIVLFERIMDEPEWNGRLFGDLSAITQRNRIRTAVPLVLRRADWGDRLLHATDYPLPGVMALFSLRWLVDHAYITTSDAQVLTEVHRHNALLFDFLVKRLMTSEGRRLVPGVFETRRVFA